MSQTDDDQAIAKMADIITLAILNAEKGDQAALQFLADALPDWRKRQVGALQTEPTLKDRTMEPTIDLDTLLPELGMSRNEFAKQFGVDPTLVLAPPSPELDRRRMVADALNVDVRYLTSDALAEIEGV